MKPKNTKSAKAVNVELSIQLRQKNENKLNHKLLSDIY